MANGAPIRIATKVVLAVPTINGKIPYLGISEIGCHINPVKLSNRDNSASGSDFFSGSDFIPISSPDSSALYSLGESEPYEAGSLDSIWVGTFGFEKNREDASLKINKKISNISNIEEPAITLIATSAILSIVLL
jgi:hypothetical protein